jgi:hypothetical protein
MLVQTERRFKIFVVPARDQSFVSFCFQLIGQGGSFCTARKCAISHHHTPVKSVKPGDIYVAKSATTAFLTPSIPTKVIDDNVLNTWRTLSLLLPASNEKSSSLPWLPPVTFLHLQLP